MTDEQNNAAATPQAVNKEDRPDMPWILRPSGVLPGESKTAPVIATIVADDVLASELQKTIKEKQQELEQQNRLHDEVNALKGRVTKLVGEINGLTRERDGYRAEVQGLKDHAKTLAPVAVNLIELVGLAARHPAHALLVAQGKAVMRDLGDIKPEPLPAILEERVKLRAIERDGVTFGALLDTDVERRKHIRVLEEENHALRASAERMRVLGTLAASREREIASKEQQIVELTAEVERLRMRAQPIAASACADNQDDESVLEEAARIVSGARQAEYGSPENNFTLIAKLWSAYLGTSIAQPGREFPFMVTPRDVCLLMVLMKAARDAGGAPKRDNLVDIAGYVQCAELIDEDQADESTP